MRKHLFWLIIALTVLCLDQISKQLAEHLLTSGPVASFLPWVNWKLAYNEGAAFSFLSQAGGWQRWLLAGLSLVVSALIVGWLIQIADKERLTAVSMALILGGAVGNLIDRLLYGHVIDFIDFYYPGNGDCLPLFQLLNGQCHWPTFNIADSAISVGAVLLLLSSFAQQRQQSPTE